MGCPPRCRCLALWGCLLWLALPLRAQYLFPVPGSSGVTGTFGEMRFAHLHPGLDISTYAVTGLPILASRAGYVWRVRASSNGYGRCIFLKHEDGYSTVYGHLERFMPALEAYMQKQQLASGRFEQDLFPTPTQFRVAQGDTIGWSGNTGDSGGPHLHFEIRDPQERILNPLPYFKDYIVDDLPPTLHQVVWHTLAPHSRVAGTWGDHPETPQRSEHLYYRTDTLLLHGPVGLAYEAWDKLNGTRNVNGHYETQLFLDSTLVYALAMDRFAFGDMMQVHLHCDFAHKMAQGNWLQRCYRVKGNTAPIYPHLLNEGILHAPDTAVHTITLLLRDYHGNEASYTRQVRWQPQAPNSVAEPHPVNSPEGQVAVVGKVLVITGPRSPQPVQLQFANQQPLAVPPAYHHPNRSVYLHPLRPQALPTQVTHPAWPAPVPTHLQVALLPGKAANFVLEGLHCQFLGYAVRDTAYVTAKAMPAPPQATSALAYEVGPAGLALFQQVRLSATPATTRDAQGHGWVSPRPGKSPAWKGPRQDAGSLTLGTWHLAQDTRPPVAVPQDFAADSPLRKGQRSLNLKLTDDLSGVAAWSVRLWLNDNPVVAEYYGLNDLVVHWLDPALPAGTHRLRLQAQDQAGNVLSRSYTIVKE